MYVDYLNYQEYGTRNAKVLSATKGNLTEDKLSRLFSMIKNKKVKIINAEKKMDYLSVFLLTAQIHILKFLMIQKKRGISMIIRWAMKVTLAYAAMIFPNGQFVIIWKWWSIF